MVVSSHLVKAKRPSKVRYNGRFHRRTKSHINTPKMFRDRVEIITPITVRNGRTSETIFFLVSTERKGDGEMKGRRQRRQRKE